MSHEIKRFGVSLEADLQQRFDRHMRNHHYTNRSEAIRDLIRRALVEDEWSGEGDVIGSITLVYDHHVSDLTQRLTAMQHDHVHEIITSMHVHLDHHNCLEVLIVRGPGKRIADLAARMRSERGVKHATLSMTSTGAELS